MKHKRSLCIVLVAFCSALITPSLVRAQKVPDHDTAYYITYPNTIVSRFYFSKKYSSVILNASNNEQYLKYKPNTPLTMGIGATYNNLTLNIAYGFGFLNHDDEKGKTKSIDLQAHFFPRKWALNLIAIKHKGLHLEPQGYAAADLNSYYYRADMQELFAGFSGYRVFNSERFSFNAAMMQNERQKKSAGSFMLGGFVYYGQIKGDSALVPGQVGNSFPKAADVHNINFFGLGLGGGYAYTVVFAKNFYITGSAIANLNINYSTAKNTIDEKKETILRPSAIYKAAIGYNSDSWNISANWAANDIWVRANSSSNDLTAPIGNYRLIFSKKIGLKKH